MKSAQVPGSGTADTASNETWRRESKLKSLVKVGLLFLVETPTRFENTILLIASPMPPVMMKRFSPLPAPTSLVKSCEPPPVK